MESCFELVLMAGLHEDCITVMRISRLRWNGLVIKKARGIRITKVLKVKVSGKVDS